MQKRACNIVTFRLITHFACHRWWLGRRPCLTLEKKTQYRVSGQAQSSCHLGTHLLRSWLHSPVGRRHGKGVREEEEDQEEEGRRRRRILVGHLRGDRHLPPGDHLPRLQVTPGTVWQIFFQTKVGWKGGGEKCNKKKMQ